MKAAIIAAAFLIHAVALYGADTSKSEASPQQEPQKTEVEALQTEIARQKLLLNALEARLQAIQTEPKQTDARAVIEIQITDDSYAVDGKETGKDELLTVIQAKTGGDKSWPLSIRPAKDTAYSRLRAVMEECSKGGFYKIGLVNPGKESGSP